MKNNPKRSYKWDKPTSFKTIYARINKTIHDEAFKRKHRLRDNSFTRNRKLPFPELITFLLNLNKGSNQQELNQYFSVIGSHTSLEQRITKSAFSQARRDLSPSAFIDLNQQAVTHYYTHCPSIKRWKGHRLCATDGSQIRVPNESDIIQTFGLSGGQDTQNPCGLGLVSCYYDVLNHIAIDTRLNHTNASERECVIEHLQRSAQANDLTLLDRGYNAFWQYSHFTTHAHYFCMRAKVGSDRIAKAFVDSGKPQAIVTYTPNKKAIDTCKAKGLSHAPITLRLIRVPLKNEVEVLITNLFDEDRYPSKVFKRLYHLRWGVEEHFKRIKQWAEIENFSGKSALSVKQDFYAKMLSVNLSLMMANAAQHIVNKTTQHRKHRYQVNYAQALSTLKHHIVLLLRGNKRIAMGKLIQQLIHAMARTPEALRPGRSFERPPHKIKNRKHYYAYARAM